MKYSDTIELLNTFVNAIFDPTSLSKNRGKSATLNYPRALKQNNNINYSMNNNVYAEPENNNIEYNKSVPEEESKSYNDNKSNDCNTKQDTSSNPQGVIDSITQEITPVRLQQAIILSEIVGKPRSKTRKRRRF